MKKPEAIVVPVVGDKGMGTMAVYQKEEMDLFLSSFRLRLGSTLRLAGGNMKLKEAVWDLMKELEARSHSF